MSNRYELARLPNGMHAYLELNSINKILQDKGLGANGSAQAFHTNNVMQRMVKYMPYLTGATIKIMIAQTNVNNPYITIDVPYAKFLYYGKLMIDLQLNAAGFLTEEGWRSRKGVNKVKSERDITYTKTKHPLAGPYWDKRLWQAEGKALTGKLQEFIRRGAK